MEIKNIELLIKSINIRRYRRMILDKRGTDGIVAKFDDIELTLTSENNYDIIALNGEDIPLETLFKFDCWLATEIDVNQTVLISYLKQVVRDFDLNVGINDIDYINGVVSLLRHLHDTSNNESFHIDFMDCDIDFIKDAFDTLGLINRTTLVKALQANDNSIVLHRDKDSNEHHSCKYNKRHLVTITNNAYGFTIIPSIRSFKDSPKDLSEHKDSSKTMYAGIKYSHGRRPIKPSLNNAVILANMFISIYTLRGLRGII